MPVWEKLCSGVKFVKHSVAEGIPFTGKSEANQSPDSHAHAISASSFSSKLVHLRTVFLSGRRHTLGLAVFGRRLMQNISKFSLALAMTLSASVYGQATPQAPAQPSDPTPTYRISVVSRTAHAVSYKHRSGSTHVDFQGTDLMPNARGEAKVESKRGALGIEAEFSDLDRPTAFGN